MSDMCGPEDPKVLQEADVIVPAKFNPIIMCFIGAISGKINLHISLCFKQKPMLV